MGSSLSWLLDRVSLKHRLKDAESIEAFWAERKDTAIRRLGTFAEARALVVELAVVSRCPLGVLQDLDMHRDIRELNENGPVGDPCDVHHIIPPRHAVGLAIEECPDGIVLETLETLPMRWTVVRKRGRIVGVGEIGMLRMESYRGCHVV